MLTFTLYDEAEIMVVQARDAPAIPVAGESIRIFHDGAGSPSVEYVVTRAEHVVSYGIWHCYVYGRKVVCKHEQARAPQSPAPEPATEARTTVDPADVIWQPLKDWSHTRPKPAPSDAPGSIDGLTTAQWRESARLAGKEVSRLRIRHNALMRERERQLTEANARIMELEPRVKELEGAAWAGPMQQDSAGTPYRIVGALVPGDVLEAYRQDKARMDLLEMKKHNLYVTSDKKWASPLPSGLFAETNTLRELADVLLRSEAEAQKGSPE